MAPPTARGARLLWLRLRREPWRGEASPEQRSRPSGANGAPPEAQQCHPAPGGSLAALAARDATLIGAAVLCTALWTSWDEGSQKILKTCFALIHGARRRRLCFLMRITASLSNHERNQPCSTAPAPRGLRTPLRAARFAACDAYQKPAAARQIYHGRKRDDVAEMHLERAAAVPGRRRGALRARWAVLASVAVPTGEPPAVRHTRCCAPQVTHHKPHTTHHTH